MENLKKSLMALAIIVSVITKLTVLTAQSSQKFR